MNRENLQRLASEWTRMAKNDIRNKIISFMREVDASERELAYVLAISEGELKQILEGNGEITLSTFAKLLIATGNALEIKPIEDTPIGDYENIPNEEEFNRPMPRPNVFNRPKPQFNDCPHFARPSFTNEHDEVDADDNEPNFPSFDDFCRKMEEMNGRRANRTTQPRDEHGRFTSANINTRHNVTPRYETSPFDNMSTDKLANIIKERLWDSEINLNTATKAELVAFLKEKDKRMNQFKRMRELEEDPKVIEFKERMRKTLNENPHLREWTKKFLGN